MDYEQSPMPQSQTTTIERRPVLTVTPSVIGPDGKHLTRGDLPPRNTKRWVIRRKAEVVAAVRGGLLSLDEACDSYNLSIEEFLSWQRAIEKHGVRGLRATRVQEYRDFSI